MPKDVAAFVERLARCLTEGRLEELVAMHRFPCAYEAQGRMEVFGRPGALVAAVACWREGQRARGLRRVGARVAALELGRPGRFRVWVQWTHHLADGTAEDGGTDLLFLSRDLRGALAVEMIDFLSLPAPDGAEPGRALTAAV